MTSQWFQVAGGALQPWQLGKNADKADFGDALVLDTDKLTWLEEHLASKV